MKTDKYLQNVSKPAWKFMCVLDYRSDTSKLQINIFQFCSPFISFSGTPVEADKTGRDILSNV